MDAVLHKKMISEVQKLKQIVSVLSIEDLVDFVNRQQMQFNQGHFVKGNLGSPLRQGMYLLAIACSQEEPTIREVLDEKKESALVKILESIFFKYGLAYFPTKDELVGGMSESWHSHRELAMPAFLHHFMGGFKASSDQIRKWIKISFDGFEKEIREKFGICHNEMLAVGDFIEAAVIGNNAANKVLFDSRLKEFHAKFVSGIKEGQDLKRLLLESRNSKEFVELMNGDDLPNPFSVSFESISKEFGEAVANSIRENFVSIRGESDSLLYITDQNPVVLKPLISCDGETFYFVANNSYHQAVIDNVEALLSGGSASKKYLPARDRRLESSTVKAFKRILSPSAIFYESAFETDDSHLEHDLVVISNDALYIVESKASPPREPLRDPTKAYQRIRDHFRSKSGIQKAYEQANALREKVLKSELTRLYDKKGKVIAEIKRSSFSEVFCVCVTREDFGPIATNLSMLLEKHGEGAYPWVVCITDLEYMFDGLLHLGKGESDLRRYINERALLHGKVFGSDELEFAGAFLKYGGLHDFITAKAGFIPLGIDESDIFDKIYFAEKKGEKYVCEPVSPGLRPFDKSYFFSRSEGGGKKGKNKSKAKSKRRMEKQSRRGNRK